MYWIRPPKSYSWTRKLGSILLSLACWSLSIWNNDKRRLNPYKFIGTSCFRRHKKQKSETTDYTVHVTSRLWKPKNKKFHSIWPLQSCLQFIMCWCAGDEKVTRTGPGFKQKDMRWSLGMSWMRTINGKVSSMPSSSTRQDNRAQAL